MTNKKEYTTIAGKASKKTREMIGKNEFKVIRIYSNGITSSITLI